MIGFDLFCMFVMSADKGHISDLEIVPQSKRNVGQ